MCSSREALEELRNKEGQGQYLGQREKVKVKEYITQRICDELVAPPS